jgi:hypothetical protein
VVVVVMAWLVRRGWAGSQPPAVGWRVEADRPRPRDWDMPQDEGWTTLTLSGDLIGGYSAEVDDPSVVVLRVRNAGRRKIRDDDWEERLAFTFPGRKVIAVETIATTTGPGPAERFLDLNIEQLPLGGSRLVIREVLLDPKDKAVRVAVLLSGPGRGIEASGLLRGGRIVQERPRRLAG